MLITWEITFSIYLHLDLIYMNQHFFIVVCTHTHTHTHTHAHTFIYLLDQVGLLTLIIPATQEAENGRIIVGG
jgi:hypothetical protein